MNMDTSESIKKNLEAAIKMLSLNCKSVAKVISRNKERELEKTLRTIEDQREEAESLKIRAQTLMFNEEVQENEVSRYGEEIDWRLEPFDDKMEELQAILEDLKEKMMIRSLRRKKKRGCNSDMKRKRE